MFELPFAEPNLGDGHDHEKYSWTQTLSEVSVHIPLPSGTKAKSVLCEIKTKTLKSGIKSQKLALEVSRRALECSFCVFQVDRRSTLYSYLQNTLPLPACRVML